MRRANAGANGHESTTDANEALDLRTGLKHPREEELIGSGKHWEQGGANEANDDQARVNGGAPDGSTRGHRGRWDPSSGDHEKTCPGIQGNPSFSCWEIFLIKAKPDVVLSE